MSTKHSCELHQQEHDSSEKEEEVQQDKKQQYTAEQEGDEDHDLCWCEQNYQD